MRGGYVCLKEKCFDVFSEQNKRTKYGEKDIIMNYTKYLMIKILSITSKLKDCHGQGT
jgi:Holliday junction resolvase-like predicted endonuclease